MDAMERGGRADRHEIRPAALPAAVARRGSHPPCCAGQKAGGVRAPAPMPATTARRRSGVTTEEHATLKSSQSIHLRRRTAGKEPGGASAAMRSSKGGTNGGRRPGIGSCIRNPSHLYKSCSSNKPLPISVRKLGSKMQVSRDLELQSSTKIWLLLKIQRCARNEFLQIQRSYSFLAIVGLRI